MIRIWGNWNQYEELTVPIVESRFFLSEEELKSLSYERLQILSDRTFYTISYAKETYVLAIHFTVPKAVPVQMNNRATTVAIVIPRGKNLNNAAKSLKGLQQAYLDFLQESKSKYNRLNKDYLREIVASWNKIYEADLVDDGEQFLINRVGVKNYGYLTYSNDEDLVHYLETPFRLDFKGALQIILVRFSNLERILPLFKKWQVSSVNSNPQYSQKYALFFPDYSPRNAVAIIRSLDEIIVHTFTREGYKPIRLEGKLSQCMNEWKVSRSEDRTSYIIGLKFEPNNHESNGKAKIIQCYIIGILIGLLLGLFSGWMFFDNSEITNPISTLHYVHDTIKVAIHDTIYIDKGSSEGTKKDPSNSVGERCTWKFSEKLNGIDFTKDDYEAERNKAYKIRGMIGPNVKYFEARKNVFIYLKGQKKADNLKKFIKDYGSYMTKVQKDALIKISNSEFYESDSRDYKSIRELLDSVCL